MVTLKHECDDCLFVLSRTGNIQQTCMAGEYEKWIRYIYTYQLSEWRYVMTRYDPEPYFEDYPAIQPIVVWA